MGGPGPLPAPPGDEQGRWLHVGYERGGTGSEHENEDADEKARNRITTGGPPGCRPA